MLVVEKPARVFRVEPKVLTLHEGIFDKFVSPPARPISLAAIEAPVMAINKHNTRLKTQKYYKYKCQLTGDIRSNKTHSWFDKLVNLQFTLINFNSYITRIQYVVQFILWQIGSLCCRGSHSDNHNRRLRQKLLQVFIVFHIIEIIAQLFHCHQVVQGVWNQRFEFGETLRILVTHEFVTNVDVVVNWHC